MIIVMLGAPGAGKGTQAQKLSEKYRIPHISTGDIFRHNLANKTPLGLEAQKFMDAGALVPDDLTIKMLLDRIAEDDCTRGYVLDGFPRTVAQAEALDHVLTLTHTPVTAAVDVDVPDDHIIRRMSGRRSCPKCGAVYHVEYIPPKREGICDECGSELVMRDDDREDTVKSRLSVYHAQTEPLIVYYHDKGLLRTVDGTRPVEEVFEEITGIL